MSFAESLLLERIQKRKAEARERYAEGSQLKQAQYEAVQEERRLLAERVRLEQREKQVRQARAEVELAIQHQIHETDSVQEEPEKRVEPIASPLAEVSWWHLLGRPWTCGWRVFLILSIIASIVLGVIAKDNRDLAPVYAAAMAGCIPLSICIFFAELAKRIHVRYRLIAAVFVLGGILSIGLTTFVNHCLPNLTESATLAGLVEEPCKGAVLVLILVVLPRVKGTLAGLAFGSAIGAGFASIETFGYAYTFGANGMPSTFVLVLRGVLSPLMHTGWTAAFGGALWFVQHPFGEKNITLRWCCAGAVLAAMIGCHCFWNSGSPVGYVPLIVWVIIFFYAKRGVQEIESLGRTSV